MEVQIGMIAKGQADKDAVVAHALHQFRQKFLFFVAKVARMDALFEASFSPLASSGDSHSHSSVTVTVMQKRQAQVQHTHDFCHQGKLVIWRHTV